MSAAGSIRIGRMLVYGRFQRYSPVLKFLFVAAALLAACRPPPAAGRRSLRERHPSSLESPDSEQRSVSEHQLAAAREGPADSVELVGHACPTPSCRLATRSAAGRWRWGRTAGCWCDRDEPATAAPPAAANWFDPPAPTGSAATAGNPAGSPAAAGPPADPPAAGAAAAPAASWRTGCAVHSRSAVCADASTIPAAVAATKLGGRGRGRGTAGAGDWPATLDPSLYGSTTRGCCLPPAPLCSAHSSLLSLPAVRSRSQRPAESRRAPRRRAPHRPRRLRAPCRHHSTGTGSGSGTGCTAGAVRARGRIPPWVRLASPC